MGSSPLSNLCFNNSQKILLNNINQVEIIGKYNKASVVNLRDSIKSIYIMKFMLSFINRRKRYKLIFHYNYKYLNILFHFLFHILSLLYNCNLFHSIFFH